MNSLKPIKKNDLDTVLLILNSLLPLKPDLLKQVIKFLTELKKTI